MTGVVRQADGVETAYVVGGGPSAGYVRFEFIGPTGYVLGVNDSAVACSRCDGLVSADRRWINERRDFIQNFPGDKYLCLYEGMDYGPPIPGVTYLRAIRLNGIPTGRSVIPCGANSGQAGIAIATLLARRVVLLGYDMVPGQTHWHGGYNWNNRDGDPYYHKWSAAFGETAAACVAAGIEVINANPESAIDCFRRDRGVVKWRTSPVS